MLNARILFYLFATNPKLPMTPTTEKFSDHTGFNLPLFNIPQSFLLQIGTASILLLLSTQKATVKALESMGEASEELFRGDRLPILPFPDASNDNTLHTTPRTKERN
ncbi:MAG: hypothetical protein GC195_01295 [Nostoc sp. RI_552]|nr:hypothetical protein [Nostoc sp. RI_552]